MVAHAIPTNSDGKRLKRSLDGIFEIDWPPFFDDIILIFSGASESNESNESDISGTDSTSTVLATTKATPSEQSPTETPTNVSPIKSTSGPTESAGPALTNGEETSVTSAETATIPTISAISATVTASTTPATVVKSVTETEATDSKGTIGSAVNTSAATISNPVLAETNANTASMAKNV